jgi:competence protein ComEC
MASADPDTMVAHFINVGQGDAILLEFSCGAVLIDTGGESTQRVLGRDRLHDYLEAFFARRADLARTLDLVVLSHPHADHTDGAQVLTTAEPALDIRNLVDDGPPDAHDSGRKGQELLEAYVVDNEGGYLGIAESDITTVSGATNDVIDPIDCSQQNNGQDPKITALWGRVDIDVGWANNRNNDSVVLRVDFGASSFLFLGDLDHQGIAAMLESYSADLGIFDVDVVKVGHHGSSNATTPAFVRASTPKIAIIQAGDSTPDDELFSAYAFGHPNRASIDMLLDPDNGVSMERPIKQVRVGIKGRRPGSTAPPQFTNMQLRRAIYSNSWDGNIAIVAKADGTLSVESEF